MEHKEKFIEQICKVVASIPKGKVASYGQVALLAGDARQARYVGRVLKYAGKMLPCHRVVASDGRLVPGWQEQRTLLEKEKVGFLPSGNVCMREYKWYP